MSAKMKKILTVVCVFIVIASGCLFYLQSQANLKAEEAAIIAAARLKEVTIKGRPPVYAFVRPTPPPPKPRDTILEWLELNPDTVGFISIEGTRVDYPVVQGTDNVYYLNYTFDHIRATRGSIFLDATVSFDPEHLARHLLIHGHHMRDGSMFQNISLYKGQKYFEEHPYVRLETLYADTIWQVFSVYVVGSNEYVPMTFRDDEAFIAYAEKTAERSIYPVDVTFTGDDKIMTLNTCSYEFNGAHTLIAAKLVEITID